MSLSKVEDEVVLMVSTKGGKDDSSYFFAQGYPFLNSRGKPVRSRIESGTIKASDFFFFNSLLGQWKVNLYKLSYR